MIRSWSPRRTLRPGLVAELLRHADRDGEAHHTDRRVVGLDQREPEHLFLAERLAETKPSLPTEPRLL